MQCPDEVIDAIAGYLRSHNANVHGSFETSKRSEALVELAHETAGSFLGCALNFLLTRALRGTWGNARFVQDGRCLSWWDALATEWIVATGILARPRRRV
jgi:hypothetical protein